MEVAECNCIYVCIDTYIMCVNMCVYVERKNNSVEMCEYSSHSHRAHNP